MFCTKCGKKITSGQKFCTGCGKSIPAAGGAQKKIKQGYFWFFLILKLLGYPILFFLMFLAVAGDIYYFGTSQTIVAISILAGLLLVVLMVILQKHVKLFRYAVTGLLTLSVLAGLGLLGVVGYRYLIQQPSSLMVTIVKGPVSGASVNIYELDANGGKGNLIAGPLTSDASGNVNFDLHSNLPKRFFIESNGGSYQSEATGQQVQLKESDVLTAVLSAGSKTVAVTPFTHMAAALAKAQIQGGATLADAVISANEAVAKQYGLKSIFDIVPVDAVNSNAAQATLEEKQYGLLLGGFAQLAKNLDVRSIDLAEALARDWSDGTVDGKENGNPITISNGPKLSNAGINGLNDATNQFAKSEKNYTSLRESSISLNPVLEKISLRITTTVLPSWVSGREGSYTITAQGGSLPLTWTVKSGSLPEGFTLSKDGIISGSFSLPSGPSSLLKKVFPDFTLEAKDQKGDTQTVTLSITVVPKPARISTYNPPTLTVGQTYKEVVATADEGIPPYRFYNEAVSGPMPLGMQITTSGANAVLTGKPSAKGSFSFRVCVIDSTETEKCGDITVVVQKVQDFSGYYKRLSWTKTKEVHHELPTDSDYDPTFNACGSADPENLQVENGRVYVLDTGANEANSAIDASGAAQISYEDTIAKGVYIDEKFQFYMSGSQAYVKGTTEERFVYDGNPKWNFECFFEFTGSRAKEEY